MAINTVQTTQSVIVTEKLLRAEIVELANTKGIKTHAPKKGQPSFTAAELGSAMALMSYGYACKIWRGNYGTHVGVESDKSKFRYTRSLYIAGYGEGSKTWAVRLANGIGCTGVIRDEYQCNVLTILLQYAQGRRTFAIKGNFNSLIESFWATEHLVIEGESVPF